MEGYLYNIILNEIRLKIAVVIPALNEERDLPKLLESLGEQSHLPDEIIVVDGGSNDKTQDIVHSYGAKMILLPKTKEYPSMNYGAGQSSADLLVFTGADTIFHRDALKHIHQRFSIDHELLAATGYRKLYNAPVAAILEYKILEFIKRVVISSRSPFRKFPVSTSLLIVRKGIFSSIGGFSDGNINADGEFGSRVNRIGKVAYLSDVKILISGRRIREMGLIGFNRHMWYVWENFLPFLSNHFRSRKEKSLANHSIMRQTAVKS